VGGRMQFACVDGPEFDGHEVDFEELNLRLRSYLPEEKVSYDQFLSGQGHTCSCKS
jgi:ferredoxin--NADP+ reductase